jgi:hypothetical protein
MTTMEIIILILSDVLFLVIGFVMSHLLRKLPISSGGNDTGETSTTDSEEIEFVPEEFMDVVLPEE